MAKRKPKKVKYIAGTISRAHKKEYALYADYAKAVSSILEKILLENSLFFQVVTCRAKSLESILKNIKKGKIKSSKIESILDMAACRVIFYLDSEIDRFIGKIYEEFGEKNVLKVKHKYSEEEYNAVHLVIQLNKERLNLVEYSKFKNLKCEIQLTTVLNHAWSEMEHDIIYKPGEGIDGFDKEEFEIIQKEFAKVMKEHIKPAGYSFQFIHQRVQKIKEGKKVFDRKFLNKIADSRSLNEMSEDLKILKSYVDEFGDKSSKSLNIMGLVKKILPKIIKYKVIEIETPFGNLPGHTRKQVLKQVLDILRPLRYVYFEDVFALILEAYHNPAFKESKEDILELAKNLSQYNYFVLKNSGYLAQVFLLEKIEQMEPQEKIKQLDILIHIAKEILIPSFEGTSLGENLTYTFHRGNLRPTENTIKIRKRMLAVLKELYSLTKDEKKRLEIIRTMGRAGSIPYGESEAEMDAMISDDAEELASFYIEKLEDSSLLIMKEMDEQIQVFERRKLGKQVSPIQELQDKLEQNEEYTFFKLVVGHDFKYDAKQTYEEAKISRELEIKKVVTSINQKNWPVWVDRIVKIQAIYTSTKDKSEFYNFRAVFLKLLVVRKSKLVLEFLENHSDLVPDFISDLLSALLSTAVANDTKRLIRKWIKAKKHMEQLVSVYMVTEKFDAQLFKEIYLRGKALKDKFLLVGLARTIAEKYEIIAGSKKLLVDLIKDLTDLGSSDWVFYIWFKKNVLLNLTRKEAGIVLDNLLIVTKIDFEVEDIILRVTEKYPDLIISFFFDRINRKVKSPKRRFWEDHYDAIPYEFDKLSALMAQNPKLIWEQIQPWYKQKDSAFRWEANQLLKKVFPTMNQELQDLLIGLVRTKKKDNLELVLDIIGRYEGEDFLFPLVFEVIKAAPKKYDDQLMSMLAQTGVVSGEDGFVLAYEAKKKIIDEKVKDAKGAEKKFLINYSRNLADRIAYEKRKSAERIELRKKGII